MQVISRNPVRDRHSNEQTESLAYELSTLGGLLQDNRAWPEISAIVQTDDFADDRSQAIFSALHGLAMDGKPFDLITVIDELERRGTLADAGGQGWLGEMVRDTPSATNVIVYATIVKRKSLERQRTDAVAKQDFDRMIDLTAEIKALETRKTVSTLHTIDEILDKPVMHAWLIKGWIERLQTIVLWGESQSYKSLLAIEIACAVAAGLEWRGNKTQKGAVLYIVGEGAGGGITRRFKAWEIANKVSLRGTPLIIREVSTRLPDDTAALMQETEQFLRERGWKLELIILDTLSRTLSGDENSQKDFGQYQHALDQIRDKFQCAVMFIHHTGHNDKTRARGASSIRCNADVELSMEPVGDKISKLHTWKVKDAGASEDMCFQLSVVELGSFDEEGTPLTSVVLRHLEDYTPASTSKLGKHENSVLKILEHNGPMLVGDLRKEFQDSIKQSNPNTAYNTLKMAWQRAYRTLKEKVAVIEESNTVSLAQGIQGIQGVQKGYMYPNVPCAEGVHRVHTSIEVYPCTHAPVPEPMPIGGNQIDDSQAAQPMESASSSITDIQIVDLRGTRDTSGGTKQGTRDTSGGTKQGTRDTSGGTKQGTRDTSGGTKPNVCLDDPPDFGTSDDSYWTSIFDGVSHE